jgi:hypothetical protein
MDGGWFINLERMLAGGEKMRTEDAIPWDIDQSTHEMSSHQPGTPGHKYSKDYFSLIFMYHKGKKMIYF